MEIISYLCLRGHEVRKVRKVHASSLEFGAKFTKKFMRKFIEEIKCMLCTDLQTQTLKIC